MRARVTVVAMVVALAGSAAASPPGWLAALRQQHVGQREILRGFPAGRELAYDSQGVPLAPRAPLPWTLSAIEIEQIRLVHGQLRIDGARLVLEYSGAGRQFDPARLGQRIELDVALGAAPVDAARAARLWHALFLAGRDELVAAVPPLWRTFLAAPPRAPGAPLPRPPRRMLPGRRPPRALYTPDPHYTDVARRLRLDGRVVLMIGIGADGAVSDVRVVRPLGAGLDEAAAREVATWRFAPATQDGRPIATSATIGMNFHIR